MPRKRSPFLLSPPFLPEANQGIHDSSVGLEKRHGFMYKRHEDVEQEGRKLASLAETLLQREFVRVLAVIGAMSDYLQQYLVGLCHLLDTIMARGENREFAKEKPCQQRFHWFSSDWGRAA